MVDALEGAKHNLRVAYSILENDDAAREGTVSYQEAQAHALVGILRLLIAKAEDEKREVRNGESVSEV